MSGSRPGPGLWLKLFGSILAGLGPGLSFLLAYQLAPGAEAGRMFFATAVFMAATVALMLASRTMQRKLWPLPWPAMIVVVMGGLTLWLRDETFIKLRPTVLYASVAVIAGLAAVTRNARLLFALRITELQFDQAGQRVVLLLSTIFGLLMALANELVWRNSSDLFWIGFQIWGPMLGFTICTTAALPTLDRHWVGRRRSEAAAP